MSPAAAGLDDASVKDASEVALALGTPLKRGLAAAEASRRLAEEGPNVLRSAPPVPQWRRILAQFHDPLVYLLLGAVSISLVAWAVEGNGHRAQ